MADHPFSVRLDTEVKDRLTALIEQSNSRSYTGQGSNSRIVGAGDRGGQRQDEVAANELTAYKTEIYDEMNQLK